MWSNVILTIGPLARISRGVNRNEFRAPGFDSRQGGPERYGGSGTDSDDYGTERAVGKKSDG